MGRDPGTPVRIRPGLSPSLIFPKILVLPEPTVPENININVEWTGRRALVALELAGPGI